MNNFEALLQEAADNDVEVESYKFNSDRIKGLYCDNTIALNKSIKTSAERACILAEELGHHHTTVGNIIDLTNSDNAKQEHKSRIWGYDRMIGLLGIIKAFEHGCQSKYEITEYLDTTEKYLEEAINYYRSKYGIYTTIDRYVIYFIPNLSVVKMF